MAERRANGEGSKILLHKSGRYYSKVALSSGRRMDVYGQTRDEVKNKRHAPLERDRLGLMTAPDKITLGEWLEKWLGLMKPQLEDTTLAVYETRIRLYIPEGLKATRLQALHRNQIKDMLADLAKCGLSYDIRTQSLQHLRAALDEAIDRDLIVVNSAHAIRVRASESDKQRRQDAVGKALTDFEMDVFLETALGDAVYPLFYAMFSLGLRRGEALGLRWKEVDFKANTVQTVVQVKSSHRSRPTVGSLKTSRSRRTLTMNGDLSEGLRERRAAQETDRAVLDEAWTENEFVFTTTLGTIFSPRDVNWAIHRLCVKANCEGLEIVVGATACRWIGTKNTTRFSARSSSPRPWVSAPISFACCAAATKPLKVNTGSLLSMDAIKSLSFVGPRAGRYWPHNGSDHCGQRSFRGCSRNSRYHPNLRCRFGSSVRTPAATPT